MSAGLKRWKPYPEYKESGVEWLGEVPAGWEVKRLRFLVATNPAKAELHLPLHASVSFAPMEAVGEYGGMQCQDRFFDEIGSGYTYFADGDILIAKITPCFENVKGAIAEKLTSGVGFGSTEFHVVRSLGSIHTKYCFWVSISYLFRKIGEAHMYGAGGQKRIADVFIKNFPLPTPPLHEQQAIAAFLDQQCAQIDSLIEKKQRMLDLLDEKRRAAITQAVTCGLDPSVPMKDSGVEWLGMVPAGWEIFSLRRLFCVKSGDMTTSTDLLDEGFQVFGGNGFRGYFDRWNTGKGVIIIGRYGALCGNIKISPDKIWATEHAFRVFPFMNFDIHFMAFFLEHLNLNRLSARAAQPGLNSEMVRDHFIAFPPLHEQQAIADYLDAQCAAMDSQRKSLEKSIELLREYRSSLITHAVTGKIDVRELAPLQ